MSKLCQTFQSPDSLHKPPYTILFDTTLLSEFVVKYLKTSSFSWIFQCRNSSLTKTTNSCSFLLERYLIVVNPSTLLYLSTIPSCMSAVGDETSEPETSLLPLMKTFLLLLTKSPNARNFYFSLCFMSFFCFIRFRFPAY